MAVKSILVNYIFERRRNLCQMYTYLFVYCILVINLTYINDMHHSTSCRTQRVKLPLGNKKYVTHIFLTNEALVNLSNKSIGNNYKMYLLSISTTKLQVYISIKKKKTKYIN